MTAILSGTSVHHRRKDSFDFTGFVFPEANFFEAEFTQDAKFSRGTFTQRANFSEAQFTQGADFTGAKFTQDADFSGATFTQGAYFSRGTFTQDAYFNSAIFTGNAYFRLATFTQDANFRGTEFRRPELVRFYQVNQKRGAPGLRARFVNCRVEGVQFADVNWRRQGGRMVLQDELDLTDRTVREEVRPTHELVAIAYRQLVSNFEKERAYDLAEDCKTSAMEMKRLDPKKFLFPKLLKSRYKKRRWLRWLGENISVASLYRWTSRYGTSYTRALLVLLGLLVILGLLFALPWSTIQRENHPCRSGECGIAWARGCSIPPWMSRPGTPCTVFLRALVTSRQPWKPSSCRRNWRCSFWHCAGGFATSSLTLSENRA